MFNVAVFRLRDILKYLVVITISILIVIAATRYFSSKKEINISINVNEGIEKIMSNTYTEVMNTQIPLIQDVQKDEEKNETNKQEITDEKLLGEFLEAEISSMKVLQEQNSQQEEIEKEVKQEEPNEIKNEENKQEETNTKAETGLKTEVVTNNPITESFNVQYGKVKIKNGTSINLTEEILKPDITIDNKNVLIFHTHSCESYTASEKYPYTPTGNFRTTDLNFTVTRVGTELETQLKQYGIPVIHNTSYHDYPSYNGSYTNSLATVQNILKTNPSDIIIDIHRDAIGSREDYAPTVKIGEDYAAQIMFVIGTNEGGLQHPNWQQNMKFAVKVQEKAEELYPGLFKPIMVTENRYNQHAGKYANIMEVGATGNTLEQCLTSMKYLAKVLEEVIQGG